MPVTKDNCVDCKYHNKRLEETLSSMRTLRLRIAKNAAGMTHNEIITWIRRAERMARFYQRQVALYIEHWDEMHYTERGRPQSSMQETG